LGQSALFGRLHGYCSDTLSVLHNLDTCFGDTICLHPFPATFRSQVPRFDVVSRVEYINWPEVGARAAKDDRRVVGFFRCFAHRNLPCFAPSIARDMGRGRRASRAANFKLTLPTFGFGGRELSESRPSAAREGSDAGVVDIILPIGRTRDLVFPEMPIGRSKAGSRGLRSDHARVLPPETAITDWKNSVRGRIRDLDFVAPGLDFVAAGLVFIAGSLDFGAAGLDFGSGAPAPAPPAEFSAP
jgi:hypothetical protein